MKVYVLQVSGKQDRLFMSLEKALDSASIIALRELGRVTIYRPNEKYYFYAVQESTMTRVKVKQTIIEE